MSAREAGMLRLWVRGHPFLCSTGLIVTAVALRIVLALRSPQPWGYAWDRYYEGVRILYDTGALPIAANCWQCYHPPVFYVLGTPLYAVGVWWFGENRLVLEPDLPLYFVTVLSWICAGITFFYCDRILRYYGFRDEYRLLGQAIALALPLLFISSWGIEADIVLTACMCAFLYEISRYFSAPDSGRNFLIAAAIWAGLAAGTKYNGLLAALTGAILIVALRLPGKDYRRFARDVAIFASIVLCIGGWKYADNTWRYGRPLVSNGTAAAGFTLGSSYHWDTYELTTFRLGALIDVFTPDAAVGTLTSLPRYGSVWTTLHGLAWSDMSFFSRPDRHGSGTEMYPVRGIAVWLPASVIILGVVPGSLAVIGLFTALNRRELAPQFLLVAVTLAVYLKWVLSQTIWALKTKYILFLLPAYLVYMLLGMRWVEEKSQRVATAVWALLCTLVAMAHLYQFEFAWGA